MTPADKRPRERWIDEKPFREAKNAIQTRCWASDFERPGTLKVIEYSIFEQAVKERDELKELHRRATRFVVPGEVDTSDAYFRILAEIKRERDEARAEIKHCENTMKLEADILAMTEAKSAKLLEVIKEVIRNSSDILAKKACSRSLAEYESKSIPTESVTLSVGELEPVDLDSIVLEPAPKRCPVCKKAWGDSTIKSGDET